MASVPAISRHDAQSLLRQVNQLLNRQLSLVCQVNGLKSTGIKAELQKRIANLINDAVIANDETRFYQIRQSVSSAISNSPAASSPGRPSHPQAHSSLVTPGIHLPRPVSLNDYTQAINNAGLANGHRTALPHGAGMASQLRFKSSPFYRVEAPICDVRVCDVMSQHRNSITVPVKLTEHSALQQCVNDESYRVMVFCAGEPNGEQNIAFPHQSELRVNGGEIKANLRGLKNKPGSTRPVDITSALRLRPNYINNVEFTYALTNKAGGHHKFYLVLNVCQKTSVDDLAKTISNGRRIPKDSVVKELNKKAQDPDVVATSQVLSLKCPLSYMRLDLPCRGLSCTHIQCFDATSYLQLQEQGPQWLCPICNKPAQFEQLAVDEYVRDILSQTPKSLETVTIEPNGRWSTKSSEEDTSQNTNADSYEHGDDDDDELEISEVSVVSGRRFETPKNPTPAASTPASGGRDSSSAAPRGAASFSGKRPAAAVIDLTLSSDDDEPIQRPAKRQHTATSITNASNSYSAPSSLGFLSESPVRFPP